MDHLKCPTRACPTGLGTLLWIVLLAGVVYSLFTVVRRWRAY